jgi:hypothetical protein
MNTDMILQEEVEDEDAIVTTIEITKWERDVLVVGLTQVLKGLGEVEMKLYELGHVKVGQGVVAEREQVQLLLRKVLS